MHARAIRLQARGSPYTGTRAAQHRWWIGVPV